MANSGDPKAAEEVAWTCHPVRHRRAAGLATAALVLVLVVAAHWLVDNVYLTALGALILVLSVLPFYLPTRYRLTEDEIEIRGLMSTKTAPWSKYRSHYVDAHGILVTPFLRPSRLDRLVGVNLRFDAPDRERVTAFVARRIEERRADAES